MEGRDVRVSTARYFSRYNRRYASQGIAEKLAERIRALLGFATVLIAMVPVALVGIAYAAWIELIVYGG